MSQVIEVIQRYEIPDLPQIELPEEDGEPLETNWHRNQMNLLIDIVRYRWREREDFFAGGNMFVLWLRLFDATGNLIPTEAEAERQRAKAAEAELAELRQKLAELEKDNRS